MTSQQLAARFAAYVWFLKQPENAAASPQEARQFAADNWRRFAAGRPDGLGKLLKAMAVSAARGQPVQARKSA